MSGSDAGPVARALIAADGVNFRAAPDGAILRALILGDEIELLGHGDPIWRRVRAGGEEGYVAARYLRSPQSPQIEALLGNARDQWRRFDKGRADARADPCRGFVGEMWAALGLDHDGRSTAPDGRDLSWSAAFVSFVVRLSGPDYAAFRFAGAHSVFVHDAIQARLLGRIDRPFWGYRIGERKPGLGDIVARNRGGRAYSYDFAESHSLYESHSGFVVEAKERVIRVLSCGGSGGDDGDDPKWRRCALDDYELDANGFILPGQRAIALLKNRATEV